MASITFRPIPCYRKCDSRGCKEMAEFEFTARSWQGETRRFFSCRKHQTDIFIKAKDGL